MSSESEIIKNPSGEKNELYNTYVLIEGLNPKSNNLIANGVHPATVQVETTLSPPIADVFDVSVASMFYSNEHNHTTRRNNTLRLSVTIPTGESYYADFTVPDGTYTTASMDEALNNIALGYGNYQMKKYDATSANLSIDFSAVQPFQLVGHKDTKFTGLCVIRVELPAGATLTILKSGKNGLNDKVVLNTLAFNLGFAQTTTDPISVGNTTAGKAVVVESEFS